MSRNACIRVGRAIAAHSGLGILATGGALPRNKVAATWWQSLVKDRLPVLDELRHIAYSEPEETTAAAVIAAEDRLVPLAPKHRVLLARYLGHLPAFVRRQLEHLNSALVTPTEARQLVPFLMRQAPRYLPGERLPGVGDLEIESCLGIGGFAEVYRARPFNRPTHPPVILKCAVGADGAKWMKHEVRILDELQARGCTDGILFAEDTFLYKTDVPAIKFPWVKGYTLEEILDAFRRTNRVPDVRWVVRLLIRFSQILSGIHRALVVHRDVKRANILIGSRPGGRNRDVFLLDFGIAGRVESLSPDEWDQRPSTKRVIDHVLVYGHSPIEASPQQLQHELSVRADDVYSAGVVAIQSLTGNFRDRIEDYDWTAALDAQSVDARLIDILRTCVAYERKDRPYDGSVMYDLLRRKAWPIVSHHATTARQAVAVNGTVGAEAQLKVCLAHAPEQAEGSDSTLDER